MTLRPTSPGAEALLGQYFPVLDHGFVALVDYMGSDEAIEQAARVSYSGGGTRAASDTRALLRYLRRHKHTTPSEMMELKFHCSMPIFIARQWIRHRTASVNEVSGRYSILPMQFYTPSRERLQRQSKTNKQGSSGESVSESQYQLIVENWQSTREQVVEDYSWMNDSDFARELARIDLPLSTYTQWYWKIDLHNLLHFLTLRVDSHAQWEIQEYGRIMAGMLKEVAPLSYEAWIDYDVCGARFSRMEREALTRFIEADAEGVAGVFTEVEVLTNEQLGNFGLKGRELEEFKAKLRVEDPPDFTLDFSKACDGSVFEERAKAALPGAKS